MSSVQRVQPGRTDISPVTRILDVLRRLTYCALLSVIASSGGGCGRNQDIVWSGEADALPRASVLTPATGPLRVSSANPRYFMDGNGKTIYLTGLHTWSNFQDRGETDPPPAFDFDRYLDILSSYNHTFTRLWSFEHARWAASTKGDVYFRPIPYERKGPGTARDGGLKFDLTTFNQEYFDRLRSRVIAAGARGIYVSVMLFQGWSIEPKLGLGNPWPGHPYHRDNNINGIDGDRDGDGDGGEVHTLADPRILALQERYVRKMIEVLDDLPNVLWEISNESHASSHEWQYHVINVIRSYQALRSRSHPIGMTAQTDGSNANLFTSPAVWVSPAEEGGYKHDPPPATGDKVILTDTDHLWGVGGGRAWVWKSFLRGLNPIYMDDLGADSEGAQKESARRAMGDTLAYASRMNLAAAVPRRNLASTTYCLADPGVEYLVYLPVEPYALPPIKGLWRLQPLVTKVSVSLRQLFRQTVTVDLTTASGTLMIEWYNPQTHQIAAQGTVPGGGRKSFTAPFAGDAILYIAAK